MGKWGGGCGFGGKTRSLFLDLVSFIYCETSMWKFIYSTNIEYLLLGEPTRVVKEFTEGLTREKEKVIHFLREERGQTHRVALAPKAGGLSLSLGFKGQGAGKRGWVHIYFGPELCQNWMCFYGVCFL